MSDETSMEQSGKLNSAAASASNGKTGATVPVSSDEALKSSLIANRRSKNESKDSAEPISTDAEAEAEHRRLYSHPGRAGAPKGNINNLKHGMYSERVVKSKTTRLRGKSRRIVQATAEAVLRDQGDIDNLSATFQFTVQRFAKRVGRLHAMDRALEKFIKRNPLVRDQPVALAKFHAFVQSLESDALETARVIGFQRIVGKDSVAERMRQIELEQQGKNDKDD